MGERFLGVRYVQQSGNRKIGGASSGKLDAVYLAIEQSCLDCPFKPEGGRNNGCWGTVERTGILNSRLQREAAGLDRRALGRQVAKAIDASWPRGVPKGQMMRLPVSGDLSVPSAVRPVASAVNRWIKRGGKGAWGYTHGWRRVSLGDWGPVSVLASVESSEDARKAKLRGYAVARVVKDFPNGDKAFVLDGHRYIPCPEQTRGITCDRCKLCFNEYSLRRRDVGIAFKAHSLVKKRALRVLDGKES